MHALSASLFFLSALFLSAVASPTPDPDHPDWSKVSIKGVQYMGTGCPDDSVSASLASDGTFLIVMFDQYIASAGPGVAKTNNTKNCQLTFELDFPAGWSLTVFDTRYDGFISLGERVSATQQSVYSWGQMPTAAFMSTWTGPIEHEDYVFTDSLVKSAYLWSSCSNGPSNLRIDTLIKVNNSKNKKGSGLLTTDSIEGKVTHKYGWKWKKC